MARTKPSRVVTRSSSTVTRSRAKKKEQNPAAAFLTSAREAKPKSKTASRRKTAKTKPTKARLYAVGKKVRVWWPPTRNKKRTDFSGAYWPAKIVDSYEGGYRVEYDNQEREDVDAEDVSPATPPVAFGEESTPLAVKEFCEVLNESETDPSAWLAQISAWDGENYTVVFPFHDSEPEIVPAMRIRRARVFDEISRTWKLIKPGQEWDDGEIGSPTELELIDESTLQSAVASLDKLEESTVKKTDGGKYKDMSSIVNGLQGKPPPEDTSHPSQTSVSQGRESGNRSKRKDPNAPKKPRSSYVFFMEKERKTVKEEDSTLRPQHIMKIVGEKWAKLTADEKEEYEEMARQDRARYLEAMKNYTPPEVASDEPGAKRAKMDRDLPRKPMTAFMFFSKELRQKLGRELGSTEKTKKISETWREMSEEEKGIYQAAAKEDKERYDKEMAEMEAAAAEQAKQQAVLMKNFAEVTSIGYQPPPLTRASPVDVEFKSALEEFDLGKAKDQILDRFVEEAYYLLLDVWREGSPKLGDAVRAYRAHIDGREEPDWKAFFTSVVGVDRTTSLTKSSEIPCEAPDAAAPASEPMSPASGGG